PEASTLSAHAALPIVGFSSTRQLWSPVAEEWPRCIASLNSPAGRQEEGTAGKKVAVLGTGANGAGIGADLVRAGLDVTFVEDREDRKSTRLNSSHVNR